ncbi:MAG TPA: oligosaccharide flippase family protein, partial [Puia sp.]|nr:oligosaccharide flippase family protein [Puia sp.]
EFSKISKIDVGANLGSLATGLALLFFIKNYWVLLLSGISYFIFQYLILASFGIRKFRLLHLFRSKLNKTTRSFGKNITLFNVVTFISLNLDNIIIGKLFGNSTLGIYSRAYEFGVTNIEKIKRPVQNVYFSDIADKDPGERSNIFFEYIFFLLTLLLPVVAIILIYGNVIINKIFGAQWSGLINMLPPFLLSSFLWVTMSFADQLLIVSQKLKKYLVLGFIKSGGGIISIIVASFWGPVILAWSYFIFHLLFFIPYCYSCFSAFAKDKKVFKTILTDTSIVTGTALLIVVLPWLLCVNEIIDPQMATLFFVFLFFTFYTILWKKIIRTRSVFFLKFLIRKHSSPGLKRSCL